MSTFSNTNAFTTREGRSTNSEFQFETTIDEEDLFGLTGEEEIENQSCSM
jgi:hypothetical protein